MIAGMVAPITASPSGSRQEELQTAFEQHRRELTGYCYRMLGSGFEAEDAVQETLVRAWRAIDGFEGRSALRSWLYRIATNVCLDMTRAPQRRARPMDLGPSSTADTTLGAALPEHAWVQPIADHKVLPDGDPADMVEERESIRLAFVAALQHLPAKQRAALILRDVLRWQAAEVAELLDTTTASVNSALQRARATLDSVQRDGAPATAVEPEQRELLARYVAAFESYDIAALVALLRDDVEFSMPPFDLWLHTPADVAGWLTGTGIGCQGSRLLATSANGGPAFGSYRLAGPDAPEGVTHQPFALQVIEVRDGRISGWHNFLYPELFAAFGLPTELRSHPS
jgi:RNA polymerase sigma-70 factor (ECF subfamily)